MILSLQIDQISPQINVFFPQKNDICIIIFTFQKTEADFEAMEQRISEAKLKHNISYLELLREVAVRCEEFVIFVREKRFGPDPTTWPQPCPHLLSPLPILSPFGTCFTSQPNFTQR